MPTLFDPMDLGDLKLRNRIWMSPLTRLRADRTGGPPNALMAEYYRQRASAGLILTEGTPVHPLGVGYANVSGIWSDDHVEGWKGVTRAVHDAGGHIFMQLWHVGRVSDPSFHGGAMPVGPSAIAARGNVRLLRPQRPYPVPHALETHEVPAVVEAFRRGAENARRAGFDGVEVHCANGYLLDQFLQDGTNKRSDLYGGSVENRARLVLDVVDGAIAVWGAGRVGVHIAPRMDSHDMGDTDPRRTFGHLALELGKRKVAFIAARESQGPDSLGPELRRLFGGLYVANEGLTRREAEAVLARGDADAVAWGKLFIANPDLPERFAADAPLNELDTENIYARGAIGYTDYPKMSSA